MALHDYYRTAPLAKPEPRKKAKAREKRHERAVVATVRPLCVARDGHCRLSYASAQALVGQCNGRSEWSHYHTHRRSKTRNQPAEDRHDQRWSLMLCELHHDHYDENRLQIEVLDSEAGCDGRIRATKDGNVWEEPA